MNKPLSALKVILGAVFILENGSDFDRLMMKRALQLAKKGWGLTYPNPMVGAVIVKDGAIIGEGWHHGPGLPHAEVEAIRSCRDDPKGATIYVTLEPSNRAVSPR